MEEILNNLSLVTYNCQGYMSSMSDVQKLLKDCHIIFLQETWLAKQLDNLSCLSMSHFAFGRADYDFYDDLVFGGCHEGTATYWSNNLKASSFSNCDGSIIGLRVFFSDGISRLGLGLETCLETRFLESRSRRSQVSSRSRSRRISVSVSKDFGLGLKLFVSRLCIDNFL